MKGLNRYRRFSLLSVLLLAVLSCVQVSSPVQAQTRQSVKIDQTIDDTLPSFGDGVLQRTAISSAKSSSTVYSDKVGAIQLSPAGALNGWRSISARLPLQIGDPGFVSIGNRLFLLTGTVNTSGSTADAYSGAVYSANVDTSNGNLITTDGTAFWTKLDDIPAVQFSKDTGCTDPVSARTRASIDGFTTTGNRGFIYVVGGAFFKDTCNSEPISGIATQVGAVQEDGSIVWSQGPDIPTEDPSNPTGNLGEFLGIENAAIATIKTTAGKYFIYIFGGERRYNTNGRAGDPLTTQISKAVYFSELNATTGAILNWRRAEDITLVSGRTDVGLSRATASPVKFDLGGGTQTPKNAIYLVGGQLISNPTLSEDFNSVIYRADLNPATGVITWVQATSEGSPPKQVAVPGGNLINASTIIYNSKLYVIGGVNNGNTLDTVPVAELNDALQLTEIPDQPDSFFVGLATAVLPNARSNHKTVVMKATPPTTPTGTEEPNAAWVYVAGGEAANGSLTDVIVRGRIGGMDESDPEIVSPTGWYYSDPFDIQINGGRAEVLEFKWFAAVDRSRSPNADIKMEYRVGVPQSGDCDAEDTFLPNAEIDTNWQEAITESSTGEFATVTGVNFVTLETGVRASCFQYRALLLTAGGPTSPVLYRTAVNKVVPGGPDIRLQELKTTVTSGVLTDIQVTIFNQNEEDAQLTQNADFNGEGLFFIDLCVSEVNKPLVVPVCPIPDGDIPDCSKAFTEVNKSDMPIDATRLLTGWKSSGSGNPPIDLRTLFVAEGTYEVLVLIDTDNQVLEGPATTSLGERNNLALPVRTITIGSAKKELFLPLVLNP